MYSYSRMASQKKSGFKHINVGKLKYGPSSRTNLIMKQYYPIQEAILPTIKAMMLYDEELNKNEVTDVQNISISQYISERGSVSSKLHIKKR